MAGFFQQSVAFGCDIVGLERILRGLHSLVQIFASWPLLFSYVSSEALSLDDVAVLKVAMDLLNGRLALIRRTMRTFWFLGLFSSGWDMYQQAGQGGPDVWLDVLSKTNLGLFGMLETVTLLDMFAIPGLEPFGPQRTKEFNRQAMIYWFVGLFVAVLSGMSKISRAYEGRATVTKQVGEKKKDTSKGGRKKNEKAETNDASEEEKKAAKSSATIRQLSWKLAADSMDMFIPAAIVGWLPLDGGIVGVIMLVTTVLTGKEVWQRCGRTLDSKKQ